MISIHIKYTISFYFLLPVLSLPTAQQTPRPGLDIYPICASGDRFVISGRCGDGYQFCPESDVVQCEVRSYVKILLLPLLLLYMFFSKWQHFCYSSSPGDIGAAYSTEKHTASVPIVRLPQAVPESVATVGAWIIGTVRLAAQTIGVVGVQPWVVVCLAILLKL
jgi:hypothetical protein